MKSLLTVIVLAMAASGLANAAARKEVPATAKPAAVQIRVIELVNEARSKGRRCARENYPPSAALIISDRLHQAARAHAQDMARREYFEHESPDGSQPRDRVRRAGYAYRLVGENIAFGPVSAEEVVAGWLNSPGHCANIMDSRFRDMGVAVARARKPGHWYWAQSLGAPAR